MDSGAVGINGLEEKNLNLQASLYIYERLNELGIPAKLTRDSDEYLPKDERIKRVLSLYNNSPNIILLSNHINAGGAEGAEVVYSLRNDSILADLILNNIGEEGQIKRKTYQRRLPEDPNRDYYYILRESGNAEPVLIEYGFIDNINDANKLKNNITNYAEAVVKAITEYIGIDYIPKENKENEYKVKDGDTLYSIARKFNISVEKLKQINNLNNNIIYKGQLLKINDNNKEVETEIYIVKNKDTLYSISKKYNISVNELKELNNLKSDELYVGEQLIVPKQDINMEEYDLYIVKKGDSLWKIAKEYNINVQDLININNLDNLALMINQELIVPKKEKIDNLYIVEKGDTLWSIAKKFDTSVENLKKINNITNNLLSINQKIITK